METFKTQLQSAQLKGNRLTLRNEEMERIWNESLRIESSQATPDSPVSGSEGGTTPCIEQDSEPEEEDDDGDEQPPSRRRKKRARHGLFAQRHSVSPIACAVCLWPLCAWVLCFMPVSN